LLQSQREKKKGSQKRNLVKISLDEKTMEVGTMMESDAERIGLAMMRYDPPTSYVIDFTVQ
jgi:hypothetical protein